MKLFKSIIAKLPYTNYDEDIAEVMLKCADCNKIVGGIDDSGIYLKNFCPFCGRKQNKKGKWRKIKGFK